MSNLSVLARELWSLIKNPQGYYQQIYYKNASMSELRELPFKQLLNITCHLNKLDSWNKMAAILDFAFPVSTIDKLPEYNIKVNSKEYAMLKYSVKYAAYAYFMPILGDPTSLEIIDKHLPLITMRRAEPAYFIGIDHTIKRIVLCIRGTLSFGDILTDLDALPEQRPFNIDYAHRSGEYKAYKVHQGLYDAARWIDTRTRSQILKYMEKHSDYSVLVTGHSLGAGVSSLLCLLWNNLDDIDNDKFFYYSFASPLVVDIYGVKECNRYNNIISVAVSSDVVTRMSVESVIEMNKRIQIIENTPNSDTYIDNIIKHRRNVQTLEQLEDKLDEPEAKLIEELMSVATRDTESVLYPCGRVLWFVPEFLTDPSQDIGDKYDKLMNLVQWQTNDYAFIQMWQFIRNIMDDITGWEDHERCLELRNESDMAWFTNMVYNGTESFNAHFPGQYTNGFNINVANVFQMSPHYERINTIPIFGKYIAKIGLVVLIVYLIVFSIVLDVINDVFSRFWSV